MTSRTDQEISDLTPSRSIVDRRFLSSSQLPFAICLISIFSIFIIFILQGVYNWKFLGAYISDKDSALVRFVFPNAIYIALFIIAIISAYVGYRMVVAAGATAKVVIPPQDYDLLAPLIKDGKADAVEIYIRLSSLTKFTGTFTQLGLTGLPLATIALTVFFALLALFSSGDNFLDLTKLTLGAFIGSFVQRQAENRIGNREGRSERSNSKDVSTKSG